tara:strand:+ start:473 stop:652 length:180 start_codon:yes stop_codon:yes gene_type:complete
MTKNTKPLTGKQLIYSYDDNRDYGKGWYWERYSDWKHSQSFSTKKEARIANSNNILHWE